MKTQCDGCAHWQARGGIILERQYECTQLADAVPAVNSSLARLLTWPTPKARASRPWPRSCFLNWIST